MKINKTMLLAYCLLLFAATAIYIGARQIDWNKLRSRSHATIIKVKKMKTGSVEVQLLPGASYSRGGTVLNADYIVRIKLRSKESLKKDLLSQYMNFGILKNIFAVQAGSILEQTACEKIPCIDRHEFVYMTCFHRPAANSDSSLLIYVADSLAGFGNSKFEFTRKTLQQLD